MSKGTKSFRQALEPKLASELLNHSDKKVATFDPSVEKHEVLGERLRLARESLESVVGEANAYLKDSDIARVLAEALARQHGKRGNPEIFVDRRGHLVLDISYDEEVPVQSDLQRPKKYKRSLPLLEDLRAEAKEMRLDISHLGAKRRAIWELITEVQDRKKAAEEPMAADADEVVLSDAPKGPKPPKKGSKSGFIKTGDPAKPKIVNPSVTAQAEPEKETPNMVDLLETAGDVDLRQLLSDDG